jgi:hypothetical protein
VQAFFYTFSKASNIGLIKHSKDTFSMSFAVKPENIFVDLEYNENH